MANQRCMYTNTSADLREAVTRLAVGGAISDSFRAAVSTILSAAPLPRGLAFRPPGRPVCPTSIVP